MSLLPLAPVADDERAHVLDALRAFALLGICLANSAVLSLFVFQRPETMQAMPTASTDKILGFLHFALIEGKFYTIFSLLFGIGFSIILVRNERAGKNPLPIFYRRLIVLALFGLAHLLLLWEGDILLLYALLGMLLPFFRKCSDRTLVILAGVLIISPLLFDMVKVLSHNKYNLANPFTRLAMASDDRVGITQENFPTYVVTHRSFSDLLHWNQSGFFWRWQMLFDTNRLPKVLGIFLIGLYVGRNQIFRQLEERKEWLKKVCRWSFAIGLPASIPFAYFEVRGGHLPDPSGLWTTLFYALSVVQLGFAYASGFALLWLKASWKKVLALIAPAGRMALTNYITQTMFGIALYYGIGLGFGGKVGPTYFFPIAIVFWMIQIVWSRAWLSVFRFGPLEWIWRMLTYGKYLPIRK
jgi:uncharacterized protein